MKKIWKIFLRFLIYFFLLFFGSSLFFVLLIKFVNPPITPLMVIRCTGQLFAGEKVVLKKKWVPIEKISKELQVAAIVSEDFKFMKHHGFDFEAMEKAKQYNAKSKTRKKGASTISQQTAKNVFLWPQRSWLRKGLEAYFTVLIEFCWSKKRIMEVYLNVIEMGDCIYGAEVASQTYFKKPAQKLSRTEAALLVAIFPNPREWNPLHPTSYLLERQAINLKNMYYYGPVEY